VVLHAGPAHAGPLQAGSEEGDDWWEVTLHGFSAGPGSWEETQMQDYVLRKLIPAFASLRHQPIRFLAKR
jgi:hypothetical protein